MRGDVDVEAGAGAGVVGAARRQRSALQEAIDRRRGATAVGGRADRRIGRAMHAAAEHFGAAGGAGRRVDGDMALVVTLSAPASGAAEPAPSASRTRVVSLDQRIEPKRPDAADDTRVQRIRRRASSGRRGRPRSPRAAARRRSRAPAASAGAVGFEDRDRGALSSRGRKRRSDRRARRRRWRRAWACASAAACGGACRRPSSTQARSNSAMRIAPPASARRQTDSQG